jgi:serine/threonine protein kinase
MILIEPIWNAISEGAKDLLKKMLEKDPEKRINARDALMDPWIQSKKFNQPSEEEAKVLFSNIKNFHVNNKILFISQR